MYNSGTTPLSTYVPADVLHSSAFGEFLSALRDRVHGRGVARGSEDEERHVRKYVADVVATGPQRLREALTLPSDATDETVTTELKALDTSAACDGCRHGDSDGRGHFACQRYHPAFDVAEELGLATAENDRSGWSWVVH